MPFSPITPFYERFVTPEDFGCAGDGVTDDRLKFNDFIQHLDGQDAYLPKGKTYRIASGGTSIFSKANSKDHFVLNGRGGVLDFSSAGTREDLL
jgi:hypothetical protein